MTTKTFAVTAPDYSTTLGENCKDSGHQRTHYPRGRSKAVFLYGDEPVLYG